MDESSRLASLSEILTYEGKAPVENLSISEGDRSPEVNSRLLACKRTWAYDSPVALILGLLIVGLCGCIIALISPVPADEEDSSQSRWGTMSRTIGATYCLCWPLSFYPQVFTNWRHPQLATRGLSYDFLVLNVIGFACYSVYTASMCFSGEVRREYAERFGSTPQVKGNDVVFAWHALLLSSVTLIQVVWIGQTSWRGRVSPRTKAFAFIWVFASALGATSVASFDVGWLGYIYFLSAIKVGISVTKYVPQAMLNYSRKSTSGFQIWNVVFDFTGGILSIAQLIGDSLQEAHAQGLNPLSGIVGNPAKFVLGMISIFFDIIFLIQHYLLYRHKCPRPALLSSISENQENDLEGTTNTPLLL